MKGPQGHQTSDQQAMKPSPHLAMTAGGAAAPLKFCLARLAQRLRNRFWRALPGADIPTCE